MRPKGIHSKFWDSKISSNAWLEVEIKKQVSRFNINLWIQIWSYKFKTQQKEFGLHVYIKRQNFRLKLRILEDSVDNSSLNQRSSFKNMIDESITTMSSRLHLRESRIGRREEHSSFEFKDEYKD